jgi:ADP-dependent NAD(P)H-hydrate dehydratase / NAD(P)H-hydrate epimerase
VELLTAAQMRAIEQAAIKSGTVTGLELMERAGQGVVEAIFEEWPELKATSHRAVVLCGPGNNGGDGFVVARLLKEWGWRVEVFLYGDPEKLPPDARVNYERWTGTVRPIPAESRTFDPWEQDLIVDALFGTGLARGLSFDLGLGTLLPEWDLNAEPDCPHVVAVDLPSGLCSDSGRSLKGDGLWADLTVSFHSGKVGHVLADGPQVSGKVVVKSIGLTGPDFVEKALRLQSNKDSSLGWVMFAPQNDVDYSDQLARRIDSVWGASFNKPFRSHKYSHGHALILSGPMGRSGAARLAARGALRVGAGVVTVAAPGTAMMECATQLTAIMLRKCEDAAALSDLLQDERINTLCLGPGLGLDRARALVTAATDGVKPRPMVLDADALTAFADDPGVLFAMLHPNCILTPHEGEFARLFPDIAEKLAAPESRGPAYSKVDATREAAKRAGCVVLFKGPDTVIASPEGHAAINSAAYDRAAPWLATAGSGDVLAGIITGLLARGFGPMQAAETGAWLHVEAALEFGPGLIAEDLPEALPNVFRRLLTPDRH